MELLGETVISSISGRLACWNEDFDQGAMSKELLVYNSFYIDVIKSIKKITKTLDGVSMGCIMRPFVAECCGERSERPVKSIG
jgi:hypothetical protein